MVGALGLLAQLGQKSFVAKKAAFVLNDDRGGTSRG